MTNIDTLLNEFIDAWNAGERPDVLDFLERADAAERAELRGALKAWLAVAPAPAYSDQTLAEIAAEPALANALAAASAQREPVAARVRRLREQAGLGVAELAASVSSAFSLPDAARVGGYLERLESGELAEERLSRRLIGALSDALGAGRGMLDPSPPLAASALFRAAGEVEDELVEEIGAMSAAVFAQAPEATMDETDRLFCGGPEG